MPDVLGLAGTDATWDGQGGLRRSSDPAIGHGIRPPDVSAAEERSWASESSLAGGHAAQASRVNGSQGISHILGEPPTSAL